ncbi:hypothetical protein [Cryobacterium cryoconiti]|uniref:DUF4386 family protein n=1 Tax=Cryobacterium cryoconiti TaxID=1259239 RepID=A0A4Y8JYI4_9MICO|nr:hypothetical protein [Cryobacterium cryoconiti]TFD34165.1 hypothetical protein E3T49_00380 [Cryobacterium cryoconiti]
MRARRVAISGGWAAVVAGMLGAGAAAFLLVVPPVVEADRYSFPLTAAGFAIIQIAFFLHHLLVVWALWAFWRAGLAGRGVLATIGGIASVLAMLALSVQELLVINAADSAYPSPLTDVIEAAFGTITLATGAALIVLGIAAVRARVLSGSGRWLMLGIGVWVIVPLTPAIFAGFELGRIAIGLWLLLFTWLGAEMIRYARTSNAAVADTVAQPRIGAGR